jgi:hypothetical protein
MDDIERMNRKQQDVDRINKMNRIRNVSRVARSSRLRVRAPSRCAFCSTRKFEQEGNRKTGKK